MYSYVWQYTDIRDGSVKKISSRSADPETIDGLFLQKFLHCAEYELGHKVLTKRGDDYPSRISDLSPESLQLFKDMQFKILDGESELRKTIGMSKWL